MTRPDPLSWLAPAAQRRQAAGLHRELAPRPAAATALDLASNDYLGLARDPRVIEAGVAALRRWGAGSTGSRLVTGTTELHTELEGALAALVGAPAALVFSSGYLANLAAVTALAGPDCLVVSDGGNHASLIDACRLSRSEITVVGHGDLAAARAALIGRRQPRALLVADAVSSIDGDLLPLAAWHRAAAEPVPCSWWTTRTAWASAVTGGGRSPRPGWPPVPTWSPPSRCPRPSARRVERCWARRP